MDEYIFLIIVISLIVSLIQVINPTFFLSPELKQYQMDNDIRNPSIYSWINLNSLGISFPIMISILLSTYSIKKKISPFIVISGVIVSFLSRSRYVMLSTIIVFSQLFFNSKFDIRKKVLIVLFFIAGILLLINISKISNLDLDQVINERIFEKGSDMASARARIASYYVFLEKFPENPWFGVGPATRSDVIWLLDGVAPLIHVGYLSYLYYYGIFGFLLLLISLILLLKIAWKVGKAFMFWGSFYGLLSFCLANATMVYFNLSEMGIILAVIYLRYYNELSISKSSQLKLSVLQH